MALRFDLHAHYVVSTYGCMPISFALVSVTENTNTPPVIAMDAP